MFVHFLKNHVLANLTFVLVLVIGFLAYNTLPRQQDPTINFNWIIITTVLPGASASDVETKVTDPLEDALRKLQDVKFMSSNSRESISTILIRFEDISTRIFDKRVNDLRREIQNQEDELPEAARDPFILEITSANAYPSAMIAVVGQAMDEQLRIQARNVEKGLEQLKGVDRVDPVGLAQPELQVSFDAEKLEQLGLNPGHVSDTVSMFFQDVAAGDSRLENDNWLVRVVGSDADPDALAQRTVVGAVKETRLADIATVSRGRNEPERIASTMDKPAVLLAVMKQANANTIELVDRIKVYMQGRNEFSERTGVDLILVDDQTVMTNNAINLMQNNALIGLSLVLLVAWLFLGSRIAFLTAIAIPFILAGTFWVLSLTGETLNVMVLLGVVIVLGMLVDDAVVVVEGIYYRLRHGVDEVTATIEALKEVAAPVTAAVLTTMAAFGPLILLPGILGDFMRVVPMVVVTALAISLLEAFWMLPAHVMALKVNFRKPGKMQQRRVKMTHWIQVKYIRLLVMFLRRKWLTLVLVVTLFLGAIGSIVAGLVKVDFFAADTIRLFYVNIEMPPSTPLEMTLKKVKQVEKIVRAAMKDEELRAAVSYAGHMFTETEARMGDQMGQVIVGLHPETADGRTVEEMIEAMRKKVAATPGPVKTSFLRLSGGPPTAKPVSVKVRGDDYAEIRAAANSLKAILKEMEGIKDISDDANMGRSELILRLDEKAIARAGANPSQVIQTVQLLVDGAVVADLRDAGEKVEVRVQAAAKQKQDIDELLDFRMTLASGKQVPLHMLVEVKREPGLGNIRHYNFRRAITVEADIEDAVIDTVTANNQIMEKWQAYQPQYPDIDLDFSGELDDIQESLDSILMLFVFGVGVMYAILGTQFRSYWQPMMILSTLFMAFTGVTFGLLVSQNPMSLYTLYGVVALAGIAVNAAIVLISAGNARLKAGMSVLHATIYAARRRVIPILITSLTTIAGLFSLAAGLGGKSLIWGPVATAIVWGLAFSTILTLIVVPLLYRLFMQRSYLLNEANCK
ncbi:MAG: efflux RND transporter permease subunit [Gammaproteobacteria bacterium]|nr:efflux RND transporter permease subunit [Gammaproteobacteria bacterium]